MMLTRMNENVFLDFNALALVRFEDMDQEATAVLKFKDGGTETITGESALNLRRHLAGSKDGEQNAQLQPAEQSEVEVEPQSGPKSPVNLGTLVMSNDIAFVGRNKAWFYRKDEKGRGIILAVVNAKGSCSLRTFDAQRGNRLGKLYRTGGYQQQFADLIEGAIELTVSSQPNLERDCKERIPEDVLAYLRKQISVE